jgi:hypothetical protein
MASYMARADPAAGLAAACRICSKRAGLIRGATPTTRVLLLMVTFFFPGGTIGFGGTALELQGVAGRIV